VQPFLLRKKWSIFIRSHNLYTTSGEAKPAIYYRYLFRSVFFAGFVIAPAGIYLLSGWPGWEQIYWSKRFEEVMHTGWVNALPVLGVI